MPAATVISSLQRDSLQHLAHIIQNFLILHPAKPRAQRGGGRCANALFKKPGFGNDFGKPWSLRRKGLVFVGNNTNERKELMNRYIDAGGALSAYGPGASAGLRFWKRRRISPAESASIYGSYQGVFNLLQPPNTVNGLNLRAYEVPASGGLGTYPETPDLALSFVPNEEIITYRNMDDLAKNTRALFHEPARANEIISAGLRRVMKDHTYARRAEQFLNAWLCRGY